LFEGLLYFVLGFLASALIALMISPVIWSRAVLLTKRRIESSVPLTLNEVQADKDQLRAEFAMSTRRLELSIEELQDKASRQVIEINRKRDELTKLASESREKIKTVEELEARSADLRSRLAEREDAFARVSADLHKAKEDLEARALDLDRLQRTVSDTRADADSKRIELVAKQTNLEDLSDKTAALEKELQELRDNARKTTVELENANNSITDSNERLNRLQKTNADLEEKLQRRERDISEIRSTDRSEEDSSTELTRLLMAERKKTDAIEARLAKTTLRMEALLSDASNENVSRAVETLNAEKADLRKKLSTISNERDKLLSEVTSYRENTGLEWDTERKDNAILRERINDLAAQVTAMTAAIEGPDSPINEILEKAENLEKSKGTKTSPNGDTLADRVRALQDAARTKSA
jgi:chromosome segregation ATPase